MKINDPDPDMQQDVWPSFQDVSLFGHSVKMVSCVCVSPGSWRVFIVGGIGSD